MTDNKDREKTIALAGVFQASTLARQLARRGYADEKPFNASVRSILITDALNTESVYGGVEGVRLGLLSMNNSVGSPEDLEVARYTISLVRLANRLQRSPELMDRIASEISRIQEEVSMEGEDQLSNSLFEGFAEIYKSTISNLKPQIIVQGEQGHLGNQHVVVQVRTSLLAGIRSAFLWEQLGGRRWHLILHRKSYAGNANRLIQEIEEPPEAQTYH